ncbi:MAG: alpha/beta hydrolase [Xanthomonadales bacterium]|nr:alpha/beta hydrolase [Xanthomonadales bacterium]
MKAAVFVSVATLAALAAVSASDLRAGPLRERMRERMQQRAGGDDGMGSAFGGAMSCADWAKRVDRLGERMQGREHGPAPDRADIAYGPAPRERLDVYLPKPAARGGAPVIVMVHGGGWCVGDKAMAGVTANKVARWVSQGVVFVSANYPMVNDGADARAQGGEIARATAYVQAHAAEWGGDPAKVVLMGHSAGAHLVSLVNADDALRRQAGVRPLLGTVSLDAGAIDVVTQMPNVYPFLKQRYLEAFGDDEAGWKAASPYHRLDRTAAPWLGVCSTQRKDDPCGQADAYARKSRALGLRAEVLPEPMGHGAINKELGEDNAYTRAVEAFLASLDPALAARLRR